MTSNKRGSDLVSSQSNKSARGISLKMQSKVEENVFKKHESKTICLNVEIL